MCFARAGGSLAYPYRDGGGCQTSRVLTGNDAERWGRSEADAVLAEALAVRGVRGEPVVLWDAGTFVYRVGNLVAKVYGPTALVDRYERAARAGARLAAAGVPVVPPVDGGNLHRSERGAVGFWPFLETVREPTWGDLGMLLRACHDTPHGVLAGVGVPRWDPTVTAHWATAPYRERHDADRGLADAIDRAAVAFTERVASLPAADAVLLHGDAQLQNVLVGAAGPYLIDLDWLAVGPPVVDTAPVVRARRSGAVSEVGYRDFVEAYGTDPEPLVGTDVVVRALGFGEVMFRLSLSCRRREPVDWLADAARSLLDDAPG